ncbi:cell division protein ZapC domain-containing protein [Paraferrimonas sp. SM1919]|uniref:cell division protein ZapC domain-containing protein n=1 Tax=Paraferrimonas sp. SM1919 TaxID=2662263 RepID=UPI0013D00460|nr:cell division protein ZapC domain-containing protein [Paraferrimonas sp. SM1919]
MLLMPNDTWQWNYDSNRDALLISLGNELNFMTELKSKNLIPDALSSQIFNTQHAIYYTQSLEMLSQQVKASEPLLVQMALNATAAKFMWQHQAPKSHLFKMSHECVYSKPGKVFYLQTEQAKGLCFVIDASATSSVVLLLSELAVSDSDLLMAFSTIKVLNSRLLPLVSSFSGHMMDYAKRA